MIVFTSIIQNSLMLGYRIKCLIPIYNIWMASWNYINSLERLYHHKRSIILREYISSLERDRIHHDKQIRKISSFASTGKENHFP